ncbi:MAG: NADH-ubiquinone oxidoreductase [Hirschia sp.]|nr:NADH-ubiquinone oxidoreductase [Hirschia sp.]
MILKVQTGQLLKICADGHDQVDALDQSLGSLMREAGMNILVIGAYGLIGQSVCRELESAGHKVTGLGRSIQKGRMIIPQISWIGADLTHLNNPAKWERHLIGQDAVINCAGLLQNGMSDNVSAVQFEAVKALVTACEETGLKKLVHISAPGVSEQSNTEFYQTKALADKCISASKLDWTILRPGLVIAPQAYGGTSLLRMLAAMPFLQPVMLADRQIQTVSVEDVADAVRRCVESSDFSRRDFDLVEDEGHGLREIVLIFRQWLGGGRPVAILSAPLWLGRLVGRVADLTGWLGWRSALRTTSLKVLELGVSGDAGPWREASGQVMKPLKQTMTALPATSQEKLYARAMLVFPLVLMLLSGFWIASGIIGLIRADAARAVLADTLPASMVNASVIGGGIGDIAIGAAMLFRPFCRLACVASIGLALCYLVGAALFAPHLWADPLGPMVKVFPAIGLALTILAIKPER